MTAPTPACQATNDTTTQRRLICQALAAPTVVTYSRHTSTANAHLADVMPAYKNRCSTGIYEEFCRVFGQFGLLRDTSSAHPCLESDSAQSGVTDSRTLFCAPSSTGRHPTLPAGSVGSPGTEVPIDRTRSGLCETVSLAQKSLAFCSRKPERIGLK